MKVSWEDLNFHDEPGAIPWLDGRLLIEKKHIDNWKKNPSAIYDVSFGGVFGSLKTYVLGSWEYRP